MSFATSLNFTSSNEDGRTELAALALSPEDRVLCLTASGTRPLDLLLEDPGDILAIDINPAQNHLLRLKIAAFKTLSDDELYAYLGLEQTADRLAMHARVETALSEDARRFWSTRTGLVRSWHWQTASSFVSPALMTFCIRIHRAPATTQPARNAPESASAAALRMN